MKKGFLQKLYLGILLIFFYAPILILVIYSFNESKIMGQWTGFTFKWYAELLRDDNVIQALYVTVGCAVIAALVSTVVGTAAAIGIHNMRPGPRNILVNITYLPLVNPDIVTGVSLMLLFIFLNMRLGFFTMLLAHITFNIPYVIFSVMPRLQQMNPHLYEAALDLGATPLQAIRRVVIPEIMPGVVSGLIMAFTMSLDDFVISRFTSVEAQNLAMLIYSRTRTGVDPTINALSAIMFVSVITLLLIANRKSLTADSKDHH
ncbi:MAG: ABC transporter permease [Clostridia bacterium]|nr:ABC transporter permease [Clostridia bacterium]